MINLYTASNYKQLFEQAGKILSGNRSIFTPSWVVVPNQYCKRWFQQSLAIQQGICAQTNFILQFGFVWEVLNKVTLNNKRQNFYSTDIMRWQLYKHLGSSNLLSEFHHFTALKKFNLAEKLASMYLNALENYPKETLTWQKNNESSKDWKINLWNAFTENTEQKSPFLSILEDISQETVTELPDAIIVFAVEQFNELQMNLLLKLSEFKTIHIMLTNPTAEYWLDMIPEKASIKKSIFNEEYSYLDFQGNPILANLGYAKLSLFDRLYSENCNDIELDYQILPPDSLLKNIKNDIYQLKEIPESCQSDDSLTIHSCHSRFREVEVVYDTVLKALDNHPELKPEEIIVVSPQIDDYITHISKVFNYQVDEQGRMLPFHIQNRNLDEQEYINALMQIINSFSGEMSAEDIFGLVSLKSISDKFEFTNEELERIKNWITDSNIRSFYSSKHKEKKDFQTNIGNTWEFGKNRWLSGYISGDTSDVSYLSTFGDLVGQNNIFIRFFRFLDLWYLCYEQSLSDKTLVMWFEFVESICEDFLYSDFDEELKLKIIKIARTCFCEQTQNCEFELPLSVIKAVLEKALADNDIRYEGKIGIRFQSWKNTFIEDAKVLIIMGLSEGEFPGNDTKNDLDIFKNKLPQLNQSKRASDKNLMLTALTSNLDKLVLTYIGYEQSTNEIIPASTVVEDLVTYLKQKTNDVFAIQHHFMHGFNQHYFSKEQQSYILNNFKLAKKYYQKSPIDKNTDIRIDKTLETVISIHQLSEFFSNPLDFFIENVAELQLKIYSNELKSTETYQPDKLEEWKLKSHIFQHDIEIAKKTGLLADSPLSHNYYNKFSKELYSLSEKYQQTEIHSQDIELNFEEFKLYGVVHLNDKNQLVDFKTGKAKGKYIIKHWISYLCYQPESESYLYFEDKIVKFNPIQNAPELLSIILEKWRLIHQQPWLFHPAAMVNVRTNDIALATEIAYYNSLKGNERFPATEGQRYFLQQLLDYDYQSDVEEYIKPLLESIELVDYSEVIDATV